MKYEIVKIYEGHPVEETEVYSLIRICEKCNITPYEIVEFVEEGIVSPDGERWSKWRFSFHHIERIHKIIRLKRDLELNFAGTALAIELLDRIEELESKLNKRKI